MTPKLLSEIFIGKSKVLTRVFFQEGEKLLARLLRLVDVNLLQVALRQQTAEHGEHPQQVGRPVHVAQLPVRIALQHLFHLPPLVRVEQLARHRLIHELHDRPPVLQQVALLRAARSRIDELAHDLLCGPPDGQLVEEVVHGDVLVVGREEGVEGGGEFYFYFQVLRVVFVFDVCFGDVRDL